MAEDDAKDSKDGAAANPHGASLRLDPKTLPAADQDFARMMGFGDEGQPPAPTAATTPAPASAGIDEDVVAASEPELVESDPSAPAREWDEIHPRPATLGRQAILIERAERVLALPPSPTAPLDTESEGRRAAVDSEPLDGPRLIAQLRARDARIRELEAGRHSLEQALEAAKRDARAVEVENAASRPEEARPMAPPIAASSGELEKSLERMRGELDDLLLERDRLGDALAVANAACAEAIARSERLEASHRAARGPHGPVPEGERALRGEVIGLRRRLEEASAESRRLRDALDASATELAIARAQGDDRLQELEQKRNEIAALEHDRASQLERLDESLARQRELLALVSRVQAENVELRSTQAALEETLEARDLEISAREEHLLVTRRGLAARDAQLVDAEERLEQERRRRELVEAELERARLAQGDLSDKLTRRDARIATLSKTLARVEEAIGRRATSITTRSDGGRSESSIDPGPSSDAAAEAADRPIAPAPIDANGAEACSHESLARPHPATDGVVAEEASRPTRPSILAPWRDAQVAAVCGPESARSTMDFLARRLAAHAVALGIPSVRVASLGGARSEAELELVSAYHGLAAGAIEVRVVDRSAESARMRKEVIEAAGQSETIAVEDWTTAARVFEPGAHALLLADATAGDASDEGLVERLSAGLAAGGIILWADRLAGGPVELSAETVARLNELWQVLPESWTRRPGFESPPAPGDDGGSPTSAADAFAALLGHFRPTVTLGFGHVADLFLGPARGFDLAEAGGAAETLLASIAAIDESRSILESLPARHGVGVLVARNADAELGADTEANRGEALGLAWPDPTL